MSDPVTVAAAAKQLGRSPATVRKWIAKGAPTVSLGKEGRGNGSMVDIAALQRWRDALQTSAQDAAGFLAQLERILADYHRAGDHRLVGLRDDAARLYLAALHEYVAGRLNRSGD